ncbi:hypothetical protein E1B28_010686 [Marasmius oreades]|uniref:DUF6533 domain-containing protein n=1 Tax=Marasmius oreades TaxID=181124 RepID=A0A9P7USY2_9AGAR|nr:uncharacterized protein E1B28_010686 [Marasmius oreades]KAG7091666.1 hypothetical protein E1B28_010686 [Marasmius oreades]
MECLFWRHLASTVIIGLNSTSIFPPLGIAMADSIPSDVNILETLQHEMIDHYFLAAGGALFIYDVFINLDVELMYIWPAVNLRKRPINKVSVAFNFMYLAQRYLPLVDQVILDQYILFGAPSTTACMIGFTMSAWCSILGILLSELMLALRIWAVWERSAFIGVILIALSLGCSAPAMFFFARFMQGIQYFEFHLSRPSQDIGRCLNLMTNRDVYICWILLMVYDSASFILMAIPGFRAYREGGSSDLVKLVYRDGVIYYALLFLVSLVNVIIILLLPHDLVIIISP